MSFASMERWGAGVRQAPAVYRGSVERTSRSVGSVGKTAVKLCCPFGSELAAGSVNGGWQRSESRPRTMSQNEGTNTHLTSTEQSSAMYRHVTSISYPAEMYDHQGN